MGDPEETHEDSADGDTRLQEHIGEGNYGTDGPESARRSSSRDRTVDSQYSPLIVPPTNGQRCR